MRDHFRIHAVIVLGTLLLLPGCASIISGRHAEVAIDSQPANACVSVYNRRGQMVASSQTPAVVTLRRGDKWFRPARYTAKIEKPGYETAHVPIRAGVNPWVLGNVVFGGIAGLVVDPFTGAAWRLPGNVRQDLAPLAGPQIAQTESPSTAPVVPANVPRVAQAAAQIGPSPVHENHHPSSEWNAPEITR